MDTGLKEIWLAIIATLAAFGAAFIKVRGARSTPAQERKTDAEADLLRIDALDKVIERLTTRLNEVEDERREDRELIEEHDAQRRQDRQLMKLLESKCEQHQNDIKRLDGEAEKWRLYSLLLTRQLDANGIAPVLTFREAERMTVEDVRRVFQESDIEIDAPPDDEV